ncbi:uracil-DNA glycosylase [Cutibacterium acnes]|nr:uracil-DNA glycosylase [Cutibacterium acnes]MCD1048735.1 uracil-DNA glycosylase [Cutibacterium acnes]MCD1049714.1 uracil-DNA glycosylase [Cutibacterium acnes]MCD1065623.1 uracil-DNA glycosylase [Cutibacterium acnes]MCD1076797.1 uracil-DNA glycosylase [Cutibacterium acnes]
MAVTKRAQWRDEPYWGRPVPSFGDPSARMVIIGLAPAAHGANRTGRMFTGDQSGDWLYRALYDADIASQAQSIDAADGLTLHDCRIIAPVHCAPPDNWPRPDEKRTCAIWFDDELARLAALRALMCLGQIAWTSTLAAARRLGWQVPRPAPRFGHGTRTQVVRPDGSIIVVLGCYHVSRQNTNTGRLTRSMLDDAVNTLRNLATT